jgi:hypothetical protein
LNSMSSRCQQCRESLDVKYFELLSDASQHENHCVCVQCFGILQAGRGCVPYFECPSSGCTAKITGHKLFEKKVAELRNTVEIIAEDYLYTAGPPIYITPPSKDWDPCRYFAAQSKATQADTILITVVFPRTIEDTTSTMDQEEQKLRVFSISVPYKEPIDAYTQATKEKLVHFMKLLYHVIIFPDPTTNGSMQAVETMESITDLEDFALLDDSIFTESMLAFVTGVSKREFLPQGGQAHPYKKSSYFAFWLACEMIRRGPSGRYLNPGILQDAIQRHLSNVLKTPILESNTEASLA